MEIFIEEKMPMEKSKLKKKKKKKKSFAC